jgi:transposase InsO family protein
MTATQNSRKQAHNLAVGRRSILSVSRSSFKRAVPKVLFCDNGSELTSHAMDLWAYCSGAKIDFSQPGKQLLTGRSL